MPLHRIQIILFVAMATAVICPAAHAQEVVSFTAQGVPTQNATTITSKAQRAVIKAFLDDNPDIDIQPFTMPAGLGNTMDSGPLMAIAAGIPPHAIYVNFRQSSSYISQGFLEPIDVLLARMLSADPRTRQTDAAGNWLADPSTGEIADAVALCKARVTTQAWPAIYTENGGVQNKGKHVWAIPTSVIVKALLYRKDLFNAAGLNPEQPPEDWEEFLSMARRLTEFNDQHQQYGFMMDRSKDMLSYRSYSFLVSNGARAVERLDDGTWRAVYDSEEAAEAVEFIWRLSKQPFERDGKVYPGAVKFGTNELDTMWARGQIAMRFDYLDEELLASINPQIIGIAPTPLSRRGTRGGELNCKMVGVFSGATPAQKLAVMRYIWFITSDQAKAIRTRIYVDNGYGQFVSPHLLRRFGYERVLLRVPPRWQEVFDKAIETGVPEPYGPNTQLIYRFMSEPIDLALEMDLTDTPQDEAVNKIRSLLSESVKEANIKMLGNIPPDQMRMRRYVATAVIICVGIAFLIGVVIVWRSFSRAAPISSEGRTRGRTMMAWLMLAPALLLTLGWMYVPLGWGLNLAFTDYRIATETHFVGVDNFAHVLFDADFWWSLARTFYFVALMIGLGFWPPILLAILLDEVPTATLKYIFRTLYYLPAIISGVIIMFLWKQLYDPSQYGALNQLWLGLNKLGPVAASMLKLIGALLMVGLLGITIYLPHKLDEISRMLKAGMYLAAFLLAGTIIGPFVAGQYDVSDLMGSFQLKPLSWVDSPQMAMFCVVLPTVWAGAGPGCLLYLAALKTIPSDLYEAADIDGAGCWHKVFYITLPRLKYLIVIQFIAALVGAFRGGTDYILAMTGGGPLDATLILALHIFTRAFIDLEFGIATAMAWLLGALLIGFTAYQLNMLSRAEFSSETTQPASSK